MAWVVPDKARHLFEDVSQGSQISGSKLLPGVVDETIVATVTKTGRCKGGRFYECDVTYFGIAAGKEVYMVKDAANAC